MPKNYLDKNINLRFRIKISFDCSGHSLFEVQRKLSRFIVSRSTFPFTPTERGHTILTVDHSTVVWRFRPIGSNLNTNHWVIPNKDSNQRNVMSVILRIWACLCRVQTLIERSSTRTQLRTMNNRTSWQSKYVPRAVRRWQRQLLCCPVLSMRCHPADWIHPSCIVSCATHRTSDRLSSVLVCSTGP